MMCSKNLVIKALSLTSLNIVNFPSYSGLGVYSKSSISDDSISLFVIRKPERIVIKVITEITQLHHQSFVQIYHYNNVFNIV